MKNFIIAVALLLAVSLTGCGTNKEIPSECSEFGFFEVKNNIGTAGFQYGCLGEKNEVGLQKAWLRGEDGYWGFENFQKRENITFYSAEKFVADNTTLVQYTKAEAV